MMKNLKIVFLIIALILSTCGLGVAYLYMEQQNRLRTREAEIENLKKSQLTMQDEIGAFQKRQQKVVLLNRDLKDRNDEFEVQKTAILTQVRSSVAGFETYRVQAGAEIEALKKSVAELENQRKTVEEKLNTVETLSRSEKETLSGQVDQLNSKIDHLNTTQGKLTETLQAKNRSTMVVETSKLHYNLGNFYVRNGDAVKAVVEYRKAISYNPSDPAAHYNLALVSDEYLNDSTTAIRHYNRYLELAPKAQDYKKIRNRALDLEMENRVAEVPEEKKDASQFTQKDPVFSKVNLIGDHR